MRFHSFILILVFQSISFILAQSSQQWFPSELNVQPFTSNFYEPKAGTSFSLAENFLRLDIGTTQDIYSFEETNTTYSFGSDLYTYTRLRSENDFKFPVETIDYFFGINFSLKHKFENGNYGLRFRLSHVSAHLVDGLYNGKNNQWQDGQLPFVFSKEFLDFFPFYQYKNIRLYLGLTYIFHVIPDKIGKGIYQWGFDYYLTQISFGELTPFISADYKISSIEEYTGNIIAKIGIKFGKVNSKGFSLLFTYYNGKSIHGELFNHDEKYSTIGFNVDL